MRKRLAVLMAMVLVPGLAWGQEGAPVARQKGAERDPNFWRAEGSKGAVAAGAKGSPEAGIEILKAGGNAADAAVATILALSVTDATAFCFGGEVPLLIYDAKSKTVEVIAGQGAAPRLATREHFAAMEGGIPATGLEPAAVPAVVDALVVTLSRHGTRTFAECAQPALRLLDQGKKDWHPDLARTIRTLIAAEATSPDNRLVGLRRVSDAFYRGQIARDIDAFCRENGGLIRYNDLAQHTTRVEDAVSVEFQGYSVVKCGIWTQGPALLQTLQMLDPAELAAWGHNAPETVHASVEALKLALADRDAYYADPLFVDVPLVGLLATDYARKRKALIDPKAASMELRPGDPRSGKPLKAREDRVGLGGPVKDTTTCLVADSQGNFVAATPSGWSGVVAGKTGVWLGTRLQSFNTWPGHPNVIEPGKRPRITLTPTLILDKDRKVACAISVAGGDNQDQTILQLVLNELVYRMPPADSVKSPRWLTEHFIGSFRQTPPKLGGLKLTSDFPESARDGLAARGHVITAGRRPLSAAPIVIDRDPKAGHLRAAGDPAAGRHALAY